ncbi:hypothetical protein RYH80_12860 [Halobaculum sp. MBLA0147]|uniref:hypothetical protein n=1 Tax=Halobaculum sp. MBLA0147 TaxID=3079934 RepID=UPI003524116E
MAQAGSEQSGEYDVGRDEMMIVSVDRTPDEHEEAYRVEWQEPANSLSLADRIRRLL